VEEELVLKKRKVYMLKDEELRVKIIWLHHNILVKDVGKYVDKCYLY